MVVLNSGLTGLAAELGKPGLPGTGFYAPQARIVTAQGNPILVDGDPVSIDLVSVKVTQVHHGVSQVSITLNNQRHDKGHNILVPTWKYNKMDALSFGDRIRVEFRYANSKTWAPMIVARITDVTYSFPASGGSLITLQGEDLLSLLKTKPSEDKGYKNKQEMEILTNTLTRAGSRLTLRPSGLKVFAETLKTVTHRKSQSYLQFIESIAERMDFEVYVDAVSPEQIHFETARSASKNIDAVDLTWNMDLIEFRPKFKVWDLYTEAVLKGRHPRRRTRITGRAKRADIGPDLHTATGGSAPMNALDVRDSFFSANDPQRENKFTDKITNLDKERADLKAIAILRKRAREFLTAEISTIGYTELVPGKHVDLHKLSVPFDGIYYITKAVHTIDASGYRTQCSLRRPGMLDPSTYPGVKNT